MTLWVSLATKLAQTGRRMVNWPDGVPFPGKYSGRTVQNMYGLTHDEVRQLRSAFASERTTPTIEEVDEATAQGG